MKGCSGLQFLDDAGDQVEVAHEDFLLLAGGAFEPAVLLHLPPPRVEAVEEGDVVEAATVGRVDHHFLGSKKASDDDALAQAAGGHGTDHGVGMIHRDLQPALLAGLIRLRHRLVVLPDLSTGRET